jgi:RNA polymerase sigma-70 factor, ECF subfamily
MMDNGLEALVAKHRPWLLTVAMNICRNRIDAEDLTQETLLRFTLVCQKSPLQDEPICIAWLVRTLRNLFISQIRKNQVRDRAKSDPAFTGDEAAPEPETTSRLATLMTDEQFAEAVASLSPTLRETFELHAAGKRNPEIAVLLGISEGAVAKRLHDARKKIREYVKEHFGIGAN